jgi:hypothetical protein
VSANRISYPGAMNISFSFMKNYTNAKVTVWCGMSAFEIMGLYFVEEGDRIPAVTSEWYQIMLEVLEVVGEVWFQKDITTMHIA